MSSDRYGLTYQRDEPALHKLELAANGGRKKNKRQVLNGEQQPRLQGKRPVRSPVFLLPS
jgi:hypothetical protein